MKSKETPNNEITKRGRPKAIATPEIMWQHFEDYKSSVKDNPIYSVQQRRASKYDVADVPTIDMPLQRPLTFEGFQNWLDDEEVITDVTDYFENKQGRYSNFVRVCSRIKRVIRQDQIEGGMAGIYNPSITQRLNALADNTNVNLTNEQPFFPE